MPIKPERRSLYGPNWPEISKRIRERDGQKCQFCGVENHRWIQRLEADKARFVYSTPDAAPLLGYRAPIRIVLTVAHLDHNPTNNDPANLKALCQRCHFTYDLEDNKKSAAETRRRKNEAKAARQRDLFKIGMPNER